MNSELEAVRLSDGTIFAKTPEGVYKLALVQFNHAKSLEELNSQQDIWNGKALRASSIVGIPDYTKLFNSMSYDDILFELTDIVSVAECRQTQNEPLDTIPCLKTLIERIKRSPEYISTQQQD